jgi:competence ComEA-like helix-hairpin-helix protein
MKSQFARVTFLSLLMVSIAAAADTDLPDGEGKDAVENSCTDCHSVKRIKTQRFDEEGWNGIVREMIENGAAINPNDLKVIVTYLAKNFGPDKTKKVNVNTAAACDISSALELTAAEADAVVQYRTEHGKFKDLSELEKVAGLADKIEAKKALIAF